MSAAEVIEGAEAILEEARAHGQLVLRIDSPDQMEVHIEKFDYTAPRIVVVPRIIGG